MILQSRKTGVFSKKQAQNRCHLVIFWFGTRPVQTRAPFRRAGMGGSGGSRRRDCSAAVLTRTGSHRTTLKGHEALRPVRSLPPDLPGHSSRQRRGSRRAANHILQRPVSGMTRILQQFDDVSLTAAQSIVVIWDISTSSEEWGICRTLTATQVQGKTPLQVLGLAGRLFFFAPLVFRALAGIKYHLPEVPGVHPCVSRATPPKSAGCWRAG